MCRHFFIEHAKTQSLRGLYLGRRLGEAYFEIASDDLHDLPIGDGRSKKLGFAVNAVDAHD
jgi:hypothetical protein